MSRVCVVRTGLANLASVLAALHRAGAEAYVSEDPQDVAAATHVLLPGVGAFGPAMQQLQTTGLAPALAARLGAGLPTLCICLGMQLLSESSAESPGVRGLGIIRVPVRRLPSNVRVPQLGWNEVLPEAGAQFLQRGHAYFANSYCLEESPEGWTVARTEHGVGFVSAMERGAVLACQFHPELSGGWGHGLLSRWLSQGGAAC